MVTPLKVKFRRHLLEQTFCKLIFKDLVRGLAPVTNHLIKTCERKENQHIPLFNLDFPFLRKHLDQEGLSCKGQKL